MYVNSRVSSNWKELCFNTCISIFLTKTLFMSSSSLLHVMSFMHIRKVCILECGCWRNDHNYVIAVT